MAQILKDAWVPEDNSDEDSPQRVCATAESLHGLVPWQAVGDDPLCSEFLQLFGFDQLEIWIQSNAGGDRDREAQIRGELASVALATGGPGLAELCRDLKDRILLRERVAANKRYGLRIQGLVKKLLEDRNKTVDVIDRGYDFHVYEAGAVDVDSDWGIFAAGQYLVEVKAARGDEIRMSPLQARTSVDQPLNYVLCVVDLRQVPAPEPSLDEVSAAIRITNDIGKQLQPLFNTVEGAAMGKQGLRVDEINQLRYCVNKSIWETGRTLEQWIGLAF